MNELLSVLWTVLYVIWVLIAIILMEPVLTDPQRELKHKLICGGAWLVFVGLFALLIAYEWQLPLTAFLIITLGSLAIEYILLQSYRALRYDGTWFTTH